MAAILDINVVRLGEASLEQGGRAGSLESCQAAVARGGGREGGVAVRVVDVQMVPVPVAAVCLQPALRDGPDEEAARGEVQVLGGAMLLRGRSVDMQSARRCCLTRRCAVYESGESKAMSGARCHACVSGGSGI